MSTTASGGIAKSGSASNLALSPAMRDLITHLPRIMHFVHLYQTTVRSSSVDDVSTAATDTPMSSDDAAAVTDHVDTSPQAGAVLIDYLQSLAWTDSTAATEVKKADETTGVTMIASDDNTPTLHSLIQRLLSAASPSPPLTFDEFASLERIAHDAPDVLLQLLHDAVDVDHADLSDVLPLWQRRTRGLVEIRSSFSRGGAR
jgi:hypothetical protein